RPHLPMRERMLEGRPGISGRVLVVDDDPRLSRIFADVLREAGFAVDTVADGGHALALLERAPFDTIISDLALPGIGGMELLRTVRERGLELPVIFVTGTPHLSTAMEAVEFGAFRYLLKPIDAEQLIEVVGRAVRIHKLADVKRQATEYLEKEEDSEHRGMSERFSRALQGLELAFQPIVQWHEKKLVAYEALLRTSEPSFQRPEKLVHAAELLGRVHELGRAIRACAAERMQKNPMRLFVNLHSEELLDEALYDPKSPLSLIASRTVLEITERAGLDHVPDVRARIDRLKKMGFSVAVDDLGAGYSGLSSFVQLDPQVAKLDIALVRNLHREPTKRKLVRTITSLCKELGITVLAEGIESREERDVLEGLGCDLQQGFLFARPGRAFPAVHW
ncbi:MAG TPA: EAL domain-containing protein, partial [Myxococcales bacterium]|nr:EAL domain-containing protein [Myxococcales bacterium]